MSDYFIFQLDFAIERGGGLVILESKAGCRIYPARGFEEFSFLGPVLFSEGPGTQHFFQRERVVQRIWSEEIGPALKTDSFLQSITVLFDLSDCQVTHIKGILEGLMCGSGSAVPMPDELMELYNLYQQELHTRWANINIWGGKLS